MNANSCETIGLVAGWGSFPVQLAQKIKAMGNTVVVAALKQHADPCLAQIADHVSWFGVCRVGGQLQYFQRHRVTKVALAGKLFKDRILYQGLGWWAHSPDLTCFRALYSNFVSHRKETTDDIVLGTIVNLFIKRGIRVLSVDELAPELLAEEGCLTRTKPTDREMRDVEFGWRAAKKLGQLDIGQSVTVRDRTILGAEAVEGTDGLIERTGVLCPRGGFTLVKVAKPQQDMRFDVPTIGRRTVENFARAGGRVIAIEAHKTIVVERQQTFELANRNGISIVAISNVAMVEHPTSRAA